MLAYMAAHRVDYKHFPKRIDEKMDESLLMKKK
jgi:hypothetical protein